MIPRTQLAPRSTVLCHVGQENKQLNKTSTDKNHRKHYHRLTLCRAIKQAIKTTDVTSLTPCSGNLPIENRPNSLTPCWAILHHQILTNHQTRINQTEHLDSLTPCPCHKQSISDWFVPTTGRVLSSRFFIDRHIECRVFFGGTGGRVGPLVIDATAEFKRTIQII